MAIDHYDQLKNLELLQLVRHGVPVYRLAQNQCQMTPDVQEIVSHPSNPIFIEPISTTLQKYVSVDLSSSGVRRNAIATYATQLDDPSIAQVSHDPQEITRHKNLQEIAQKVDGQTLPSPSVHQVVKTGDQAS